MEFVRKYWKALVIIIVITSTAVGAWALITPSAKDIYNTTDLQIREANIVSKETGDDGFYLKVDVPGMAGSPYYALTTQDFYQNAVTGTKVGIVLGYVDTYKVKPSRDKLRLTIEYSSNSYEVLALYPSLEEAKKENQPVSFTTLATLKQRVKSDDYRYFFLLDSGGKKVMAEVSKDYYDKYTPASAPENSFEIKFTGLGDFNQLVGIVNPK